MRAFMIAILAALYVSLRAAAGVVQPVTDWSAGAFVWRATSGDCATVVGYRDSFVLADQRAEYWTLARGRTLVPGLPSLWQSYAYAASGDGSVIVGTYFNPQGQNSGGGFRYAGGRGFQDLGELMSGDQITPTVVNGDGRVIAGIRYNYAQGDSAFLWTASGGMEMLPPPPPGGAAGFPLVPAQITSDGSAIFGLVNGTPARWTRTGGTQFLPGSISSNANIVGVSDDGTRALLSYVQGVGATMWREDASLWVVPGLTASRRFNAIGMSDDASIIAGSSSYPGSGLVPAIWSSQTGTITFSDFLARNQVDLSGYTVMNMLSMSGDGRTFLLDVQGIDGSNRFIGLLQVPCIGAMPLLSVIAIGPRRQRKAVRACEGSGTPLPRTAAL